MKAYCSIGGTAPIILWCRH